MPSSALPSFDPPPSGVPTDEEAVDRRLLWLLGRADQAEALAIIFDTHGEAAYAFARRICGPAAAEDVVREAFLGFWREVTSGTVHSPVRVRLFRLTRESALARLPGARRSSDPTADVALRPPVVIPGIVSPVATDVHDRQARAAFETLLQIERDCIEFAYFDGLAVPAIADRCRLPPSVVKAHLASGLRKMHDHLTALAPWSAAPPRSTSAEPPSRRRVMRLRLPRGKRPPRRVAPTGRTADVLCSPLTFASRQAAVRP